MQNIMETTEQLISLGSLRQRLVGSTYILGAGSDIDILALVSDKEVFANRMKLPWKREGDPAYPTSYFISMRKEDINVVLVDDPTTYDKFILAAEVCKALRLEKKSDRVKVHEIIRGGKTASEV